MEHRGIILYKGKSQIDAKTIVVIATGVFGKSLNKKTGDIIQTWILRADIIPTLAHRLGYDYSICGDCKHRHFGSCYVNIGHEPNRIFQAYVNDKYVAFDPAIHSQYFENKNIRLGSYGDPAAVPIEVWDNICSLSKNFSGYTHQWNSKIVNPRLKKYCMASVDTTDEYIKAGNLGWRTFRVKKETDLLLDNETLCPASRDNSTVTCDKCNCCNGLDSANMNNICIDVHGLDMKVIKFDKGIKQMKYKKAWMNRTFEYPFKKRKVKKVAKSK